MNGFFLLIAAGCIFGGVLGLDKASCTGKWEESGFATKWGPVKGCIVQVPNGKWLPEDVIREMDLREIPKDAAK